MPNTASSLNLQAKPARNGNPHSNNGTRELTARLQGLIADLAAADQLRNASLRQLRELRRDIYRGARHAGVSPPVLRAMARLQAGGKGGSTNGGRGGSETASPVA